jgi:hypothetical protein
LEHRGGIEPANTAFAGPKQPVFQAFTATLRHLKVRMGLRTMVENGLEILLGKETGIRGLIAKKSV